MKVLLPKAPAPLLNFQFEVGLLLLIQHSLVGEYAPE